MLILKPLAFWNAACDNYQPLTGVYVSKSSSVRYTYYQIFPCFVVIESIFRSRKVKPKWNCFPSTLCLTLNNENGYSVGNNGSRYPLTIRSDYSLTKIQSIMLICSFIEFSSGSHNHDKTQQMSVNHKKLVFSRITRITFTYHKDRGSLFIKQHDVLSQSLGDTELVESHRQTVMTAQLNIFSSRIPQDWMLW